MGRIFKPTRPLLDAAGQPIIGPDGKPKRVPRTENYYIRVYDANGKAKDISTGSPLITVAKRMLHDEESKKSKGQPIGAHVGRITFDEAVKAVIEDQKMNRRRSTTREQGRIDNHLTPYFGGRRMVNITTDAIRDYVRARQQAGAGNGTINRELQILRRAFRLAQQAGKLLSVPYAKKLKEPPARQGFFERAEFEATRDQLPAHLRGLLTFYYWTGWRLSEARELELRHVDLATHTLRLEESKNDEGREFHFGPLDELRDVLTAQVASAERISRATDRIVVALFHHLDGSPVTENQWKTIWNKARKAAGYPKKLVHDFRRTAVRNLTRAQVPNTVAMKLTGHKTRSVFDRYDITDNTDKVVAAEALQAYVTNRAKGAKKQAQVRQFKKTGANRR